MSGQGRYRPLWLYYCSLVQAVIFVVDVTDVDRIATARNELKTLFEPDSRRPRTLFQKISTIESEIGRPCFSFRMRRMMTRHRLLSAVQFPSSFSLSFETRSS